MYSKEYIINIRPVPWKRPGRNQSHFYDQQHNEKLVYGLSIMREHGDSPKFEGPLELNITFFMPIQKLTRNRQSTPYHWTVPDLDNLTKHLLDSITKTEAIWTDDRQVAKITLEKVYDKKPRVYFKITELR